MGLYWAHTPETGIHHYPMNPYLESTGKEGERKTEEFLEARPQSRHRGNGVQLGRDREDDP